MSTWYELTSEQLKALPTHRLYNVYKLWQKKCGYLSYYSTDYFGYKNSDDEKQYVDGESTRQFIKTILDERGHIERDEPKPKTGKLSKQALRRAARSWSYYWRTPKPPEPKCLIENPEDCIGKQVFKQSKKPFKSKNFYNTVKAITENPHTSRNAFTFEEDSSIVDVHICNLRKVK